MHHSTRRQPPSARLRALLLGTAISVLHSGVAQASTPSITSFDCPISLGGGLYQCYVAFNGDNQTIATWSRRGIVNDLPGESVYIGTCVPGTSHSIRVTVSNPEGGAQASATFLCE